MKMETQYISTTGHQSMTDKAGKCPACGVGRLFAKQRNATLEFAGREELYMKRFLECDHCSAISTPPEDVEGNSLRINDAKLRALGSPSRAELRKMRAHWRLTQDTAGRLLGVGPTAFSKYENGEVVPAAPTARLLHLVCTDPDAVPRLARHYAVTLKERLEEVSGLGGVVNRHFAGLNPDHLHFTLNIAQPSSGVRGTMYLGSIPVESSTSRDRGGRK